MPYVSLSLRNVIFRPDLAGEKTLTERRIGQHTYIKGGAILKRAQCLYLPPHEIVCLLAARNVGRCCRLCELPGRKVRHADMPDLSAFLQLRHCRDSVLDRYIRIGIVDEVQVQIIQSHSLQAHFHTLRYFDRVSPPFGHDDHPVSDLLYRFADQYFGIIVAYCRIDDIYSALNRLFDDLKDVAFRHPSPVPLTAELPGSEGDHTDLEIRFPKPSVFHGCLLLKAACLTMAIICTPPQWWASSCKA